MIARTWRGWARAGTAAAYEHHYRTEVAAHLRRVPGFLGARLLRGTEGDEVVFTSITYFAGPDDVRAFAGDDVGAAMVEGEARRVLTRWDERVRHDEVVVTIAGGIG
ncbi:antibiotic biosynthesis monooxygenase family protein [Actinoplanes sp. URMC 104]|uniref:antibiotic biosynthesis monooxygenase family protein n=1 Tax=Actinoplanes sp. URMC 104 TaxID=3423409 RepID=UPI003F1AE5E0